MITINVDSKIHILSPPDETDRWPGIMEQIYRDMVLPNPAYAEAVKYNRSTRDIPKEIILQEYDQQEEIISLPRGYAGRLLAMLKNQVHPHQLVDSRVKFPPVNFGSRITLRDYQVPAVEVLLKATQGVLQAPAGSGKTQVGLEVIARVGQPALWLTHTKDLAEQAANRAAKILNIPRGEIGMLGAGRESVGNRLTIGIIQKLVLMDLAPLAEQWGCVVIDEVHRSPAHTWTTVINQLPARYRYGLTATPERADGLEVITNRVIGPTLYIISRSAVEASGGVVTPELRTIRTGFESKAWERYKALAKSCEEHGVKPPTIPFGDILAEVLDDRGRNNLIVNTLVRECPGHSSLVLSERVNHCKELVYLLQERRPDLQAVVIHGKLNKTKRREILAAMNAGELDVLFAVDIAKEGLDIPRLDRLFLVGGGRNEAEVEQKVGRIQRAFDGKRDAVVFDFVDERIGVLQAQYYVRRRVYKKLGVRMEKRISGNEGVA